MNVPKMSYRRLARWPVAVALIALLIGILGASVVAGGAPASNSQKEASIFDTTVAKLPKTLPAVTIDLGGGEHVSFKKGEPLRIAMDGYGAGFPYTAPEYTASRIEAKQLGISITTFDPAGDVTTQIHQLQDIIASGKYNALVVYPLVATGLECNLLTKQMPAHGILVAVIGSPACSGQDSSPGLLTTITDVNGTEPSFVPWWKYILAHNPKNSDVLLVGGPATDYTTVIAIAALKSIEGSYPSVKFTVLHGDYTTPTAERLVEDALTTDSKVSVIANLGPEATQGTLQAIKSEGKRGISVYDQGADAYTLSQLIKGTLKMDVPGYPYTNTKSAFDALDIARHGGKVPSYVPYAGHVVESIRPKGDSILFLTKSNAAVFQRLLQEF